MRKHLLHIICCSAFMALAFLAPIAGVDAQGGKVQEGLESIKEPFPDTVVDEEKGIQDLTKTVLEWALYLAGIIAIIFVIYGGFQYMTAGGNDSRAAAGRKTLVNALIGLVIIVFAWFIVQAVYRFLVDNGT